MFEFDIKSKNKLNFDMKFIFVELYKFAHMFN